MPGRHRFARIAVRTISFVMPRPSGATSRRNGSWPARSVNLPTARPAMIPAASSGFRWI